MQNSNQNATLNKNHYDNLYSQVSIKNILDKLNNLDDFLDDATKTDTSWVGLYYNNFKDKLKGKKILEVGCGDCLNSAIMASLGAEVYSNDISSVSGDIIQSLNQHCNFKYQIKFINGDITKSELQSDFFDIVIGKALIHHLTHEQELNLMRFAFKILKKDGMLRYFEPAINNKFIDNIRWALPISGRPSSLQKQAFAKWKANDPHPERDNSSKHYRQMGEDFFDTIVIIPIGTLERFHKFMPKGNLNRKYRRLAFKLERLLPHYINSSFARSQLIVYSNLKK